MDLVIIPLFIFPFFLFSNHSFDENDQNLFSHKRWEMLETQIISRGIKDSNVIKAMLKVPRHKFIPEKLRILAYNDSPVPIGFDQTISQPYIVALMTELLRLKENNKVLEVGTGSGYQAVLLAEMGCEVFTVEILEPLASNAQKIIRELGYNKIYLKTGDGYRGWPEYAPFDAIIVSAAPEHTPQPLIDQLKEGGRLVIPVGDLYQELIIIHKTSKGIEKKNVTPVRFVPMTGEAETVRNN